MFVIDENDHAQSLLNFHEEAWRSSFKSFINLELVNEFFQPRDNDAEWVWLSVLKILFLLNIKLLHYLGAVVILLVTLGFYFL